MRVNGIPMRTIWLAADAAVEILDQTRLPHEVANVRVTTLDGMVEAIRTMRVRGAPLIGIAAAFGVALALRADSSDEALAAAKAALAASRPTAVNLAWALERVSARAGKASPSARADEALDEALAMAEEDITCCRAIGKHGADLIQAIARRKAGRRVNVLTHCNAGWLATVDYGTALAPIYAARDRGIALHVWVDETRPRNQGAALTAFELGQEGIAHTVIVDSAGGHLMQHGRVDMVIAGADRITRCGDAANKIGTYLKALAARDNAVPFHIAAPSSTIDWSLTDGLSQIPIEERDGAEVIGIEGALEDGRRAYVRIAAPGSAAANYAFDVTPARLISGLITERGCCVASAAALANLFPEAAAGSLTRR